MVWQGEGEDRRGRFVIKFSRQSKQWEKGELRMEKMDEFGTGLRKGDHLLAMDLVAGYRHVHQHPSMVIFLFHMRWGPVPALGSAFRMGALRVSFLSILQTICPIPQAQGLSSTVVSGRLLGVSGKIWVVPKLQGRFSLDTGCYGSAGPLKARYKRSMGRRSHKARPLGFHSRYRSDDVLSYGEQAEYDEDDGKETPRSSKNGKRASICADSLLFLWQGGLSDTTGTARNILFAVPLHGYVIGGKGAECCKSQARKFEKRDLPSWRKLSTEGRYMLQQEPILCAHSDAADSGLGGTLSDHMEAGVNGKGTQGI